MLRNYLKVALRSITKNKVFSTINIIGLAISLTGFILMSLHLESEWNYDQFHEQAENIYRVVDDKQTPDVTLYEASSAAPVAPALLNDFPEIKAAVRLLPINLSLQNGDKMDQERAGLIADSSFFEVFSFPLLDGDQTTALKAPNSMVLTRKIAQKYFGESSPIGKSLIAEGNVFNITGIVENTPANSHFTFDFLVSMTTAEQKGSGYDWLFTNWYSNQFYTYLLLPANYNSNELQAKLQAFDQRHDEPGDNTIHHYSLEKLTDIYLRSDRQNQIGETGSLANMYIFSIVAIFILLIACINFINLSTARAAGRAKEVGIKKVAGAGKWQLRLQFLVESLLMTAISLTIAGVLAKQIIPLFNQFSGKTLSLNFFTPLHLSLFIGLFIIVSLLAGVYPAAILSSFQPAKALKGTIPTSPWNIGIRKGLVVLQFTVSVVLIVGSLVVYRQMQFMQGHDLGFKLSQTLVIDFEGNETVSDKYEVIKEELLRVAGVRSITGSSRVPGDGKTDGWSMNFSTMTGDTFRTELPIYNVDYQFLDQYNIKVVAGRDFSKAIVADGEESMLINETAVKSLGFDSPEKAIGLHVDMYPRMGKIIGVFKDFNFESLQKPITPLAMRIFPFGKRFLSLELDTKNLPQTIASIEKTWSTLVPDRPLQYNFLDEGFNRQYESEIKFAQVLGLFTALAILIACLGLFGLALFSVQQRTKEVGIRKVLGASVANIVRLLSQDFLYLTLISAFIAFPVAWYFMSQWLQNFSYHTDISWGTFALAGILMIGITILTVSFQSIRAALANPVESLRNE